MAEGATIMYPAFLSFAEMKVMFTGAPWPRSQFGRLYCWAWYGSRPVISEVRDGEQNTKASGEKEEGGRSSTRDS